MAEKEKSSKKDVDALLTEVASAAGVPKKAAAKAAPSAKPAAKPAEEKKSLRIRHEVVRPDTPAVRGQILKVRHLVEVVGE